MVWLFAGSVWCAGDGLERYDISGNGGLSASELVKCLTEILPSADLKKAFLILPVMMALCFPSEKCIFGGQVQRSGQVRYSAVVQ